MRLLAVGPADSTIQLGHKILEVDKDIKTIGLHRSFPYLKQKHDVDLDYWTWGDPNSTKMGFDFIRENPKEPIPHIILPYWFKTIQQFNKMSGTSQINNFPDRIKEYEETLNKFASQGKLTYIDNAIPTRKLTEDNRLDIITDPKKRFDGNQIVFGTVPFDGKHSESQWAQENKFTTFILPISTFLGSSEVYCLGFDNRGPRINSNIPQAHNDSKTIKNYMSKLNPWVNQWADYHRIKIYSVTPDKFTPNNQILEYKPLEEL